MWKQRDWEGGGRQQNEDNFLLLEPLEGSTFKPPLSIVRFAGPPSCLLCVSSLLCLLFSQVGECFPGDITSLGKIAILFQPALLPVRRDKIRIFYRIPSGLENFNLHSYFFGGLPLFAPINLNCSLFSLPPLPASPTMAKKEKVPLNLNSSLVLL